MIKPDCYIQTGKIINEIYRNGFTISKLKMSKFTRTQLAEQFYQEHRGKPFFSDLTAFMQSDVVTGMELVSENAISKFRDLMGPKQTSSSIQEAKA
jgi:nucleoside-diphosphate kinase